MGNNLLQRLLDLSEDEIIAFMGDQPLNSPEHATAEQALTISQRREGRSSSFLNFFKNPWIIGIGTTVVAGIILWLLLPEVPQTQSDLLNVSAGRDIKDSVIIQDLHINSQADRHLEDRYTDSLDSRLLGYEDKELWITASLNDIEAGQFANEIKMYLEKKGWRVSGVDYAMMAFSPPFHEITVLPIEEETKIQIHIGANPN